MNSTVKHVRLGNISFSALSFSEALDWVDRHASIVGTCRQVIVANAYSVVLSEEDSEFRRICNSSDLVLADGKPVVWLSRMVGQALPERIAGPDFMWECCGVCARKGRRVFLLGGTAETLTDLENSLIACFPRLTIAGTYSPPYGEWSAEENSQIIRQINSSEADVLWVGVSTPKQDKWINQVKSRINAKIAIGVGAAFDFHSGNRKRAPKWMQSSGLEWSHRLLQEPGRLWKRYLIGNAAFLRIAFREIAKRAMNAR